MSLATAMLAAGVLCLAAAPPQGDGTWVKLADPPKDLLGREAPPGMDGAWVYVPEWRGFLLYGGFTPTYSNEGWFFDPDAKDWTLLWAHDALAYDTAAAAWRELLPRDLSWSLDRPGPVRGMAAVSVPDRKQVFLLGGHPAAGVDDGRGLTRDRWWGPTQLGLWTLDPAGGRFLHLGNEGPRGMLAAAYDSANRLIVVAPLNRAPEGRKNDMVTWVYSLETGTWQGRTTPDTPTSRRSGFAFDERAKKCILFHSGTWTYDAAANVWTEAKPAISPPDRHHAGLCYDRARGVTILHGGVVNLKGHGGNASFEAILGGKAFGDTWAYDAVKNEWTELKPAESPPLTFSARNQLAYDSDREACVLYDVAVGVWALRRAEKKAPPRTAPLPALVRKAPPAGPLLDDQALAWQEKLKALADDSWLETPARLPPLGCMNTLYDSYHRCIVQIGGCGGAMFQAGDDNSYHNGAWLFDMDVGRFYLRRAAHTWGPTTPEFLRTRLPAGCTRGHCFDSKRRVVWCIGGNGTPLLNSPRTIRSYDVTADLSSAAGPLSPRGHDGECEQLAYDTKHDLVVLVDTRRKFRTFLYSPAAGTWSDGGPAPKPCCTSAAFFGYAHRAYDPQLGVIVVVRTAKDWMPGETWPENPEWVMRTLAYDAGTKTWRDLAPAGQEKIPACNTPGIAYDSRNRAVIMVKGDYGGSEDHSPGVPYGTLYVLDLASNTWKAGKPFHTGSGIGTLAYDPNHNVVIRMSGGRLLLYRYKGGCPPDAFAPGRTTAD